MNRKRAGLNHLLGSPSQAENTEARGYASSHAGTAHTLAHTQKHVRTHATHTNAGRHIDTCSQMGHRTERSEGLKM